MVALSDGQLDQNKLFYFHVIVGRQLFASLMGNDRHNMLVEKLARPGQRLQQLCSETPLF